MTILDELVNQGAIPSTPIELYSDMFKFGESMIQSFNNEKNNLTANPLIYLKNNDEEHGRYKIMFEDQIEDILKEASNYDFAISNGLTYFGRKNVQAHASKMFAMIFDLDGIEITNIKNLFSGFAYWYPIPNYIVASGHGLHLYYIFDWPLPLYPNIKLQLKELKYALTRKIWNMYTSTIEKPQYQGINQGFRIPGSKTKIAGYNSKVFKLNEHPWSLQALCEFVPDEFRVDEKALFKESKLSLEEAKRKYPKWYERIVVNKQATKRWVVKRDLYDWWLRKIESGASIGHRYFCVMALSIYASKCHISFEELKKDAYGLIPFLNSLGEEPFTENDVKSALECYDERYIKFQRDDISKITAIQIDKNKRNGRSRKDHVKMMNLIRDEINNNTTWNKIGNGRKSKKDKIRQWKKENPGASKYQCIRETGISKSTVYKWWDIED